MVLGVTACIQTSPNAGGEPNRACEFSGIYSDAEGPDFLIRNAVLIDGTGAPRRKADIRVREGTVEEIGMLCPAEDEAVLDAAGLIIAPGFIDTHSHHDVGMANSDRARSLEAAVSQGVTTIVVGQDGRSVFPITDLARRLERMPVAVNVASYTGHGTLRLNATGTHYQREATSDEVAMMEKQLSEDIANGSLGLSTGLEYDPGIYSNSQEILALADVLAEKGGRYISHLRSEDKNLDNALEEIIRIGSEAGIPVQISHFKIAYMDFWGQAPEFLNRLNDARARGVDITADAYPYDYWQSTLTVLLPDRDLGDLEAARAALEHSAPADGLTIVKFDANPALIGKTVQEIAEERDIEPARAYLDLIQEAYAGQDLEDVIASGVAQELVLGRSMDSTDIRTLMLWTYTNISSDGTASGGHPRGYGAFTRSIRWLVRDEQAISLEEMIRKCTSLSARNVGLGGRGVLRPGSQADLVLFDAEEISDRADITDPMAPSVGIDGVWVNGERVWADGAVTGRYPGRFLSRQDLSAQ
ncbi:MAG: amidohydrolase family protein [Alphaproteobacteria bacterium]|nr:amidohydrolase family protein [Alphaproteobacteria bacterium]